MNYIKAAKKMYREIWFEDWMSEHDWQEFERESMKQTGITYEMMADTIKAGVDKGYSVGLQMTKARELREHKL